MPWQNEMHVSQALTNISVKYRPTGMIAEELFPRVPVKKETDQYFVYGTANFRPDQDLRANRGAANEVDYDVSTSSYDLYERALFGLVSDRDRANADPAIQPEIDVTENLTDKILLGRELRCYQQMTTTVWSQNQTQVTTTSWVYNSTTSDPIADVDTATANIIAQSGMKPNTIAMGYPVFTALKHHVNILERIKYSERGIVTTDILSSLFDLERVLVSSAIRDTAQEGLTVSLAPIWSPDGTSTNVFVGYVAPSPGLRKISAGYHLTISYQGGPFKVKKWREEKRASDVIEVSTMDAVQPIATMCGYLIASALIA